MIDYVEETITVRRRKTWMIEGTWSGYKSSQRRVVHREYTQNIKRAEAISKLHSIGYTDNTWLYLAVTDATGQHWRKRPPVIHGYGSLIDQCLDTGKRMVAELPR